MIFVVALDPASIIASGSKGVLGGDHLAGIFQSLLQNCLLAEFAGTWRLSEELKCAVKTISDQDARKKLVTMLEKLADPTRNRFVDVIHGHEDDYDTAVGTLLAGQTGNRDLDIIVCETAVLSGAVEVTSIERFNQSNFARTRSQKACSMIYSPGSKEAAEVLDEAFGRLIRHAATIAIFDRVMGKNFGDNYFEALGHWCRFFRESDRQVSIHFHTTRGQESCIKEKLFKEFDQSSVSFDVVVHDEDEQPHDRFLRARGFTLDLGRGVDLFDREGNCRDIKIGLSDHGAFTREWGHLGD